MSFSQMIKAFRNDQSGATSIEYALIAVIIAVGIIASLTQVGVSVRGLFDRVVNAFSTV